MQLKIYYQERGLELNKKFANSLELLTSDGKYNYFAYLLADENGMSIKVAKYAGKDKVDLADGKNLVESVLIRESLITFQFHGQKKRKKLLNEQRIDE